jgi:hypothetical protein
MGTWDWLLLTTIHFIHNISQFPDIAAQFAHLCQTSLGRFRIPSSKSEHIVHVTHMVNGSLTSAGASNTSCDM